ncbi:MAG: hypothetical protein J6N92_01345 [Alloprevotella sp.]|nr:hypothetical protein [Alloprevotella sp.]
MKVLLVILLLVAASVLLLSVRLWFGKRFVHTHIDGNRPLNQRGIRCVKEMDRQERRENPHKVNESSKKQ